MDQREWRKTSRLDAAWYKLQRAAQIRIGPRIPWHKAPPAKKRAITSKQAHDSTRRKRARADRAEKLAGRSTPP